jgi:hypothetical protein
MQAFMLEMEIKQFHVCYLGFWGKRNPTWSTFCKIIEGRKSNSISNLENRRLRKIKY